METVCLPTDVGAFTAHPAGASLAESDNAMLECLTNGYPSPVYSWTKDGAPLESGDGIIIHGMAWLLYLITCIL